MWQKESNTENANYKDICNKPKTSDRPEVIYESMKSFGEMEPKPKSDEGSYMCRTMGNDLYGRNQLYSAMELYNRSICCARSPSSELVSLAYANRSACFIDLKMYDKCLVDIDLAKKANYPERLMAKLNKRQEDCLRLIAEGDQAVSFQPKLSFESDKNFPCMANVLEIKRNDQFGRHVTSKCDIAVGETILMEQAYVTTHRYEKFRRCDGCMKKDVNLFPCKNCSNTMFCGSECEANDFHRVECGVQLVPNEDCNDNQLHIIRSLVRSINIFANVKELQEFVEDAISSDPLEIPESILDEKSRYRAFLKMWHEPDVFKRNMFGQQVYFVYKKLLENPIIGPKFETTQEKFFLMHLVAQHYCIINYSGNIRFDNSDDLTGWDFNEFRSVITHYFNHSCAPNVTLVSFEGFNVCITIRPIKKGEQLFLSYFRNDRMKHSTPERRMYLLDRGRFYCKCERCENLKPTAAECNEVKMDACYRFIGQNKHKFNFGVDGVIEEKTAKLLEGKCIEFLNKHGQKIWSQEMDFVIDFFRRLLSTKFKNKIYF